MNFSKIFEKFLNSRLQIRLFFSVSFILFAIIIAVISFVINYNYEQESLKKTIQERADNVIKNKVTLLEHTIQMQINNIIAISQNKTFNSYMQNDNEDTKVKALFEQVIDSHKEIMQMRYLDENGLEKIRIDRKFLNGPYRIVHKDELQDKSKRYYFEQTKILNRGEYWLSDIDLNIENGKVQVPFVPTLRVATPVYIESQFKGILIINLFMDSLLQKLTQNEFFMISLVDQDGHILVGSQYVGNKLFDFSWSRYLMDTVHKSEFLPKFIKDILHSYKFSTDFIHSCKVSKDLRLQQSLFLVLVVKKEEIDKLKEETIHKIIDTLGLVLLLSGPLGIALALIPSLLAERVNKTRHDLQNKTQLFDEYLDAMNINNIISKADLKGTITYVNDNFCKVSGYTKEEVLGKPHSIIRHPDSKSELFKILWLTIQAGKTWKGILRNKKKNGGYYDVDIAIVPVKDVKGKIIEYFAIRHDITELLRQRQSLMTLAGEDSLTGEGNRFKILNDIKEHKVNNVAVIDIDGFSFINDFYGNEVGDQVITGFAMLLKNHLTDEFLLYRLHSDKFAILNYTLSTERFTNFITHLNTTMIESTVTTTVKEFDVITTTGISSEDNANILLTAEIANKHAKKINQKVLVYSSSLDIESKFEKNIEWNEKIKLALKEDRMVLVYQPIYNNVTEKIEKYECLIRLQDKDGDLISPFHFLENAKKTGQYIDISKCVVKQAFERFKDNDKEFSINLTMEDIFNTEFVTYLEEMMYNYNIADRLVLEIVESEEIENYAEIEKFTNRMKQNGCKIAIDDFGTGYSNFVYLIKLNVDYVKIDGSLIKSIHEDENVKQIVKTIISFTNEINCKAIAEYVSSEEVFQTVKDLRIEYSQGYHIGVPDIKLMDEA